MLSLRFSSSFLTPEDGMWLPKWRRDEKRSFYTLPLLWRNAERKRKMFLIYFIYSVTPRYLAAAQPVILPRFLLTPHPTPHPTPPLLPPLARPSSPLTSTPTRSIPLSSREYVLLCYWLRPHLEATASRSAEGCTSGSFFWVNFSFISEMPLTKRLQHSRPPPPPLSFLTVTPPSPSRPSPPPRRTSLFSH